MNVELCEDNSGTSKKMRYFRKNKVGALACRACALDPPLQTCTLTCRTLHYLISTSSVISHVLVLLRMSQPAVCLPPIFSDDYFYSFFSQNADYTNHQIADLSEKLEQAESQVRKLLKL